MRERLRAKRSLIVITATGAALVAAGTAGAATVDSLAAGPESAAGRATLPQAQTADARPAPRTSPSAPADQSGQQAHERLQQAQEAATRSLSATTSPERKTPPPPAEETGGSSGSAGGSQLSPTGQGGSCEASMYSEPQPTASGEQFDPSAMTAAHKTLPMDTMVEVTNPDNGASVTVRINDRGPYVAGRCLDLSTASFEKIASPSAGVVDVEWQVVG
ncbi:septal ring lytic transglycosylase RlpA family protein [Streptomonospora sp. PA3]|nr:septal ring lytic transglycosylase RlpA family protein [Streptomonospora sp. PA3]MUL40645.1 septal ring lytic transglycosylase RlpA family protein [Streptomonospora sp. PA3]